jgi:hypothetical protein
MLPVIRIAALLMVSFACAAQEVPRPPCGAGATSPAYAAAGASPSVATWKSLRWEAAPGCLPWPAGHYRLIVGLAGRFRHAGGGEALRTRFGAISAMRGVRYWSASDDAWRVLIEDASALEGPERGKRRSDFAPRELKGGATLYFLERDNRSGEVVYRMHVLEAGASRLVVATENVTPVRALGFTVFPPGALRAAYFVQRVDAQTWSFYGLSATSDEASALSGLSEASYVNRATALYRHFTGDGARTP